MKVTFPHMGNLAITARPVLEGLGLEVVVPPPCSKRTLSLGAQYSPECACLPLKVNLGNYLEAAELGADTILMAGGVGPCRIGYYAQIQREILKDLGYDMEMVVLEPPDAHFSEVVDKIKYLANAPWQEGVRGAVLAWKKTCAVDAVEREVQRTRARELTAGTVDRIYRDALQVLDMAANSRQVRQAAEESIAALSRVPVDRERQVVKVAVVGEIYTVLEPFVNLDLERHLGRLGVEVVRFMSLSQWINDHLLGGLFRGRSAKHLKDMARPYLNHFVGGHGRETVGAAVASARAGLDGVIQLAPLTCMPEIVAQSILPAVSGDYGLPTLTIYLDEQSGEAGLVTRLEAFVDMIVWRKQQSGVKVNKKVERGGKPFARIFGD